MKTRSLVILIAHMLALVIVALYLRVEIYHWPEAKPFQGEQWYNPYQGVLNLRPLRANFHAHTKSWLGATFGENSERELSEAYEAKGYDIIGISNYHSISTHLDSSKLYIPVYEHGINLLKVHNLVLGASEVLLPVFPFHLSMHQTQQMLNRTRRISALNALCHPTMSRIQPKKMGRVSGYSLLEVGNTLGMSTAHWDMALSAGRLVWILSNDDTHDLVREPTFIKWNMIFSDEPKASAALAALRKGAHYGVESYRGLCENVDIRRCNIDNDTLIIAMAEGVNRIDLYGQGGNLIATVARDSMIAYPLGPRDTYIRAEVHMDECVYYLNPVVRTIDGTPLLASTYSPEVDQLSTWGTRILLSVIFLWLAYRSYRIVTDHRSA